MSDAKRETPAMQGCPEECTAEVQGYPAPCEMYPMESFAGCAHACAVETLRAALTERVDALRAELAELRAEKNAEPAAWGCYDTECCYLAWTEHGARSFEYAYNASADEQGKPHCRVVPLFPRAAAVSQERQDDR